MSQSDPPLRRLENRSLRNHTTYTQIWAENWPQRNTHWSQGTGQMNAEQGKWTLKSILSPVVPDSDCRKKIKHTTVSAEDISHGQSADFQNWSWIWRDRLDLTLQSKDVALTLTILISTRLDSTEPDPFHWGSALTYAVVPRSWRGTRQCYVCRSDPTIPLRALTLTM